MFNYLDDLNDNQFQAVTTNKQKVLVMAGAGSGKTRVLTTRIRYLLDNGVDPAEICAFTFTNKAAREMQSRIKQQLGEDFSCHIQTFHSYCWSFIRLPFYRRSCRCHGVRTEMRQGCGGDAGPDPLL